MIDYLRHGALIGATVALVAHFATGAGTGSAHSLLFLWVLCGAALGALVGMTISLSTRNDEKKRPVSGRTGTGEFPPSVPTARKFYAVSREPSSTELRALMVDAPAIPGNPIGSRLQLIVERYDAYVIVPLSEGSLLEHTIEELRDIAKEHATDRAPVSSGDLDLQLTYFRSEGPLDSSGRSPDGWLLVFIDGEIGIRAEVLVTAQSLMIVFRTAVSYPKLGEFTLLAPRKAIESATKTVPGFEDKPLYLRANLPNAYYVYTRSPLLTVAVSEETGEVLGAELLPDAVLERTDDDLTVASIVDSLNAETKDDTTQELLDRKQGTVRPLATRLFDLRGPVSVKELTRAIRASSKEGTHIGDVLLHLLSRVPSTLAILALHKLSEELEGDLKPVASTLFDRRRRLELDVYPDPLEPLDFEEAGALIGRGGCSRLPLRSTFDPESDLLPALEALGLKKSRVRLLSGDTELFLSAHLSTSDRLNQALLSSSPLPVPCHILRIVGPEADTLAHLVEASQVYYSVDEIVADIISGRPTAIHRGALYIAALGLNRPETFTALADAVGKHRSNTELRKACVAALIQLSHPDVVPYLKELEDPTLVTFSRELLEKKEAARREERAKRALSGAWEVQE